MTHWRASAFPRLTGSVPFSWLLLRSKKVSAGKFPQKSGTAPVSAFPLRSRWFKVVRLAKKFGMLPVRPTPAIVKYVSAVNAVNEVKLLKSMLPARVPPHVCATMEVVEGGTLKIAATFTVTVDGILHEAICAQRATTEAGRVPLSGSAPKSS